MILLAADTNLSLPHSRLSWESPSVEMVSGSDGWSRASRRLINEMRDEQGCALSLA